LTVASSFPCRPAPQSNDADRRLDLELLAAGDHRAAGRDPQYMPDHACQLWKQLEMQASGEVTMALVLNDDVNYRAYN
jgi:hypothetical protein